MISTAQFRKFIRPAILGGLGLLALLCSWSRVFDLYELQTYDWRCQMRGARPTSSDIVYVDIWDDTVKTLGAWPFDREYHAILIQALQTAGAKAALFDVLFVEPHPSDPLVVQAAQEAKNVYFAFVFKDPKKNPAGIFNADEMEPLLNSYAKAARNTGFANTKADRDGKRRRGIPLITYEGKTYYQLSVQAAMDVLGVDPAQIRLTPKKSLSLSPEHVIPLDEEGCFNITYAGKWGKDFKHYSYLDVVSAYLQRASGEKPVMDLAELKGKICVIGLVTTASHDTSPIPIQTVYPMVGSQANILNSILKQDFVVRTGRAQNMLLCLALMLWVGFVSLRLSPFSALWRTLMMLTVLSAGVIFVFVRWGIWIDLFYPFLMLVVIYAGSTLNRVLIEIKNREVIEGELRTASQIQRSFLPETLPNIPGIHVAVYMKPAKAVGGDLYAFLPLGSGKLGVMIGDVSGKGTPAALFMAKTVSEFKFSARGELDPARMMSALNDSVASESTGGLFVTLGYAIFDLENKKILLANAGHLPMLAARASGGAEEFAPDGTPVGVMPGMEYLTMERAFAPGDCFVFYTDGVSEARNRRGEEFGVPALKTLLTENRSGSAQETVDRVSQELWKFIGKAEQHDDITLIVVKIEAA